MQWIALLITAAASNRTQSQHGEDAYIEARYFPTQSTGVFVEMGAMDGITLSNSLLFERKGWSGLLIEGHPTNYRRLLENMRRRNRSVAVHSAVCNQSRMTRFASKPPAASLSVDLDHADPNHLAHWYKTQHPTFNLVPCLPLSTLLRGHRHVDLFSLDIEGGEYDALMTIDWTYNTFTLFVIEVYRALRHDRAQQSRIVELLAQNGYTLCEYIKPNIFVARSCPQRS